VSEIVGIAKKLTLKIAINAVYEDPPPKPIDEYAKATIKNIPANIYTDMERSSNNQLSFKKCYSIIWS
jgi:hypothetical protein